MLVMTKPVQRIERRTDALSKARIVEAAIAILDAEGEDALTFRALAAHLATGSGAIYHHVADKDELLAAAADAVIVRAASEGEPEATPRAAIHALALGIFDAIDAHAWAGAQLSRAPWQSAMGRIFESIGQQVQALGVPEGAQFDAASALLAYIVGVAGQNAANARLMPAGTDRNTFLSEVASRWTQGDPGRYPFIRQVTAQLGDHDDRRQFLAGIDLILAGIATRRSAP